MKFVAALVATFLLVAAVVAYAILPGARFLSRMSDGATAGERANDGLAIREARIPFPVRIYEPTAGFDRAIVLIHGLHWRGYDEERLVAFARALAKTGLAVLTPDIEELRNFDIRASAVDGIERACLWTLDESGIVRRDGRIGLMGICFSGGLGLSAATRASLRGRLAYVFTFGSHADLDRTIAYLATGRLPDGTVQKPHPYGQAVLLRMFADRLVPPGDVEGLRAGALEVLHDDNDAARTRMSSLGTDAQSLLRLCLDWKTEELGALLAPHVMSGRTPDVLSPIRMPPPGCPVFALHGGVDNVVPPTEALELGRWCPQARVLVTDLVVHVELDKAKHPSWKQYFDLAAFWTKILHS